MFDLNGVSELGELMEVALGVIRLFPEEIRLD